MIEKISEINPIDEENGIVDIDYIKRKCSDVFDKYNVNFCYLFGSYSKGKAKPTSNKLIHKRLTGHLHLDPIFFISLIQRMAIRILP